MAEHTRANDKNSRVFAHQSEVLLGVLTAIDRDANISQRTLSRELGVALGLANAYLKRCVRKGLVKIQHVPRRRYAYYLTPHGFAEKTRLTGQYLATSFTFFRRAREQMSALVRDCLDAGRERIAVAGISDLAEVATLCAQDHGVTFVAVIDPAHAGKKFRGLPVVGSLAECGDVDVVIVTSLVDLESVFPNLESDLRTGRVVAPALLGLRAERVSGAASKELAAE